MTDREFPNHYTDTTMTDEFELTDATRRTVLRAIGGAAAVAGASGAASAHEFDSGGDDEDGDDGGHDHTDASLHGDTGNVELLDYHGLGDVGPSSESGSPDEPHYGGLTEIRVQGDYAYVTIFSSKDPTNNRGLAVVDVSEFNAAETPNELRDAELEVVSFLRNDNDAAAVMDVKIADDGDYVFLSKQPITALFNETDPTPNTEDDDLDTSVGAAALEAVDVSDPTDPTVVGRYDEWTTGPHNAWHHRIDGTDYVFAIKDIDDGTSGLYVFEFDRLTGALVLVNRWTREGDWSDGEVVGDGLTYIHDVVVQDDPRLNVPVAYVSYWDAGLFALDVSDPTSVSVLGHHTGEQIHYAEPAPTFVDDTRVVVAGQEMPGQEDGSSGELYLLDADGIDEGYDGEDNIELLDTWEWQSNVTFDDFTLSPHNFNVTERGYVHLGHYHGGTRFLEIDSGDWTLSEKGYFQAAMSVPEDSKMTGLNHAAPFTWAAVAQNGVTFVSDVNTGVYALRFKPDSSGNDLKSGSLAAVATAGIGTWLYRHHDRIANAIGRLRGGRSNSE